MATGRINKPTCATSFAKAVLQAGGIPAHLAIRRNRLRLQGPQARLACLVIELTIMNLAASALQSARRCSSAAVRQSARGLAAQWVAVKGQRLARWLAAARELIWR